MLWKHKVEFYFVLFLTVPDIVSQFHFNSYLSLVSHFSVLQHGSLPVINPLGEKVPKNFYLEKESGTKVTFSLLTDNSSLVARVSYPKSGPWYGAAYLPESDGKIRPAVWLFSK